MTIDEAISGMTDAEARAYVLAQFDALPLPPPFAIGDVMVIVQSKVVDDRGLVVDAIVVRGDRMIELPLGAMPIIDAYPAWKISDGTYTEKQINLPSGGTRTVRIGNLVEDLAGALRYRVGSVVASSIKGAV